LFGVSLALANHSGQQAKLTASRVLFAHEGGYAFDLGNGVKEDGSFFGVKSIAGDGVPLALSLKYAWSTPLTHAVFRLNASTAGGPLVGAIALPLLRDGFAEPVSSPFEGQDALIGVQGPLEVVELAGGQRWLTLVGQVINWTLKTPKITTLRATLRQGAEVVFDEDIKPSLVSAGSSSTLKPFLAAWALPSTFSGGELTLEGSVALGSQDIPLSRVLPVKFVDAIELSAPLAGLWRWGNGQGEEVLHTHFQHPEQRYAHDLTMRKNGTSHQGDPAKNESYFAWGKPVRAAASGKVAAVVDDVPDNNGNQDNPANNPKRNSFILLDHGGGIFTIYSHIREASAQVNVGQQVSAGDTLAALGNAGFSSEPHLHFACFRIDETGRPRALPLRVQGLKTTGGVASPGVPRGGTEYETP
jgi:hypothetical protein